MQTILRANIQDMQVKVLRCLHRRSGGDLLSFYPEQGIHCSVAFGLSLTQEQTNKLNNIEKTCLKIILQEMYVGHIESCKMVGIVPLAERRQSRMLAYAIKCANHPQNSRCLPLNEAWQVDPQTREREMFKVNFARTSTFKMSTIATCQPLLNAHYAPLTAGLQEG